MEHRDVHDLFQLVFNIIAFRRRNVFQIDPCKGRFQRFYNSDEFVRIRLVDADRNGVYIAKAFEQDRLAFHNRHGCVRADAAQTQHAGAVRADAYHVAATGVFKGHFRMRLNLLTGFRHARGISHGQIVPVLQGYLTTDLHLTMIVQMQF